MPHRISFALQKGGVGKTTSTCIAAVILAEAGYKVLVVDFDSQGNATSMLSGNSMYKYSGRTIMEAIREEAAADYVVPIKENLFLIPAEDKLATFSRYIYTQKVGNPTRVLARTLAPIENDYDFIFVDVGPSLGDQMINGIVYVDHIIAPVDHGAFSLEALDRFVEFIDETRGEGHTKAEVLGILMTMKDSRSKHEREISETLRQLYGDKVFETAIRRLAKIKESAANGVDVLSKNLMDYIDLVQEILDRVAEKEGKHHG